MDKEKITQQIKELHQQKEMGSSFDDESTDQYLTFIMADEEYGVEILSVQEIRGWEEPTPIPNTPEHIKGVINLRGTIVPIIDLRLRFNLPKVEYSPLTVVIVLKVDIGEKSRIMGIVVDAVSDVHSVSQEELKEAPDFGTNVGVGYIKGLATVNEQMLIILNTNQLLNLDDIPELSEESAN